MPALAAHCNPLQPNDNKLATSMLCTHLHRMLCLVVSRHQSLVMRESIEGEEGKKERRHRSFAPSSTAKREEKVMLLLMQSCRAQLQINNRLMCQAKYSHHHHHDHHLVVNPLLNDITKRQIFLPLNLITLLSRRRCKRRGIKSLLRSSSKRALARAPLNRKSHKRRVYAPLVNAHESFSVN